MTDYKLVIKDNCNCVIIDNKTLEKMTDFEIYKYLEMHPDYRLGVM